jgi:uncharacterized protein YndB with AHSA1/START domain
MCRSSFALALFVITAMMAASAETGQDLPVNSNTGNLIHATAVLHCPPAEAFRHFTDSGLLAEWLADRAEVEPKVGGKYEIFWKSPPAPPNRGTSGCKISVLVPDKLLAFDWIGPTMFDDAMNIADPATHVVVTFVPLPGGATEVHLVHSGWGHSPAWDKPRLWFERAWNGALKGLAAKFEKR